jgi:hypothetical protein
VLWGLAGLALAQVALALALEGPRPELRDPEYGVKVRALGRVVKEHPGRPLVLTLGSSRTAHALRAGRLEPPPGDPAAPIVFNFGLTAHGPVKELLALNRLLGDGIRPAAVVLEQTPLLLPAPGGGLDRVQLERQKWGDLRVLRDFEPDRGFYAEWFAERAVPCYTSRYPILSRYLPAFVPWAHRESLAWENTDGWGWLDMPPLVSEESARRVREDVLRQHREVLADYHVAEAAERAARAALSRCAAEGIRAALVLMPEDSAVRACYPPAAEAELQGYLGRLRADFGVPVFDARGWCPDDGFRDGHHLLEPGADIFTERFGREVLPALAVR